MRHPARALIALIGAALLLPAVAACSTSSTAGTTSTASTTSAGTTTNSASAASSAGTSSASGDATQADTGSSRTVDTAYGPVIVPVDPQAVAAVSYDTPWQLMSLGVTPVAVQDYSRYQTYFTPEQLAFVAEVPTIGGYGEPDLEALAAAAPDVIVGDAYEIDEAMFAQLSQIAPTVAIGGERGDWEGVTQALADVVGKTATWEDTRAAYTATLDRLKQQYATVIADNRWIHFSLGNSEGEFSVQQPTGATGKLVVDELGLQYGPGVPTDWDPAGYGSYSLEQLGSVFDGVTVALYPAQVDGSTASTIQAIIDNPLFVALPVAQQHRVYGIPVGVTDYVTAVNWLAAVESQVLSQL